MSKLTYADLINHGEHTVKTLRHKFHSTRTTSDFHVDPEDFFSLLMYVDLMRRELGHDYDEE